MRVLIVEDEPALSRQLRQSLADAGYAVDAAADGARADFLARTESYDAVLLDLGLPKIDGLTLLRQWREAGVKMPVLMLTARGSWHEKVQGIDGGADDYMAKPFQMEEVLARLRALIRRASGQLAPELRCGDVALDTRLGRVTLAGSPVKLTSHEFRVLSYLMHHPGRLVSQSELTEHIYAQDFDRDSNTVEVFIARLRKKLGADIIETVRGLGYRMEGGAGMKNRSLRARIVAGSLLWIAGLLLIQFMIGSAIVHQRPSWIPVVHFSFIWVSAGIFILAGFLQLRMGLSPLNRLRATLTDVRAGRKPRLEGSYPSEIQALADDLNNLLDERDARVSRAQSQAGDLAHALKTPLAVLSSEMDRVSSGAPQNEDIVAAARQQIDRMRRQMDWHLARARAAASGPSAGLRASVRDSADGIARTVRRLHADRRIAIDVNMPTDVFTRAERPDLDEILGNLIDNACKYARARVAIAATAASGVVTITVDDDGPGLEPAMRAAVLQRGVRADEAPGGSGFGLAIVRDLAELYGGGIVLETSPLGGLRAVLTMKGNEGQ